MTEKSDHPPAARSVAAAHTRGLIARLARRDPDTLADRARLFADLGLNSASVLELLVLLERELGVTLDIGTLEPGHLETVGSLSDYVAAAASGPCT